MPRRLLMIAYHFPPYGGSSGLLRSLKFVKYLPEHGWYPTVLTADPRVYDQLDPARVAEVPDRVRVVRTLALDTKRHLAIRSRYPAWLALPDRWVAWSLSAVPAGLRILRDSKIDAIFSTYPIASAILIGLALHRLSGKPWIVDFRDPMTEEAYPPDPLTRRAHLWIESRVLRYASRIVFTTESTRRMYLTRYPGLEPEKCIVVPNGYDESDFAELPIGREPGGDGRSPRLLHSGIVYPHERDPLPLFRAVGTLRDQGRLANGDLRIDLRGCGFEAEYRRSIDALRIGELVRLLPPLPYRESLADAAGADGLLLMQGESCDRQIPAKLYEYLRLGRPILALTTQRGDTAALLRRTGGATIVNLHDEQQIADNLPGFLATVRSRQHPLPDRSIVETYSRRRQAGLLAAHLESLSS